MGFRFVKEPEGAPYDLKLRTKRFALDIIRLVAALPPGKTGEVLGRQLLRSATSVGANYRSALRSRSNADFVSRITIAEEEADESMYWLELLDEASVVSSEIVGPLSREAGELTAIFCASGKTARVRGTSRSNPKPRQRQR